MAKESSDLEKQRNNLPLRYNQEGANIYVSALLNYFEIPS